MFKKMVKQCLNKEFGHRCDDNGLLFYYNTCDFPGLKDEDFSFTSTNLNILRGKIFTTNLTSIKDPIIFCHGMGGGYLSYMKEIAYLAFKLNRPIIAFDYTATFSSDGKCLIGFNEPTIDLFNCIEHLKNDKRFTHSKFSLIGHSWGGYTVGNYLNFNNDIDKAVLISAPISYKNVVLDRLPVVLGFLWPTIKKNEIDLFGDYARYDLLKSISNTKSNVLVLHSSDDKVVSYKKNFVELKEKINSYNVTFKTVYNKGHNPTYKEDASKYLQTVFKNAKKIKNSELKNYFLQVDWQKATSLDDEVMNYICEFLK